jgi:PKD repeat protein
MMSTFSRYALILAVLAAAGCTTEKTPIPDLTGPSEMSLGLHVQVSPDSILGDGGSQAVINIEALGPNGQPVRGLTVRVEQVEGGVFYDFGTLSAKSVVTGDDGRTRIIFTAPRVTTDAVVTFVVTPVGSDFRGEITRTADLRVVPTGVIQPPNSPPVARFSVTPAAPQVLQAVSFDASASTDGVDASGNEIRCGANCTYQWDFGDGDTATGVFATHTYRTAGNFQARLTVTDARGASDTTAQSIAVGAGQAPTANFTFSPTTPAVGERVFFNGATSQAASGRTIVSYSWNFGDGASGSGASPSHAYGTAGTYRVTLTVTDSAGQTDTSDPVQVTVTAGGTGTSPTAVFTFSPTQPTISQPVFFNAAASRAVTGRTIVTYDWNFGDGTVGTGVTTSKTYTVAGTYVVTLTVVDDAGQRATTSQSVTVSSATAQPPTAAFTFSPTDPAAGQTVFFNASGSTSGAGRTIVSYQWTFGDGKSATGVQVSNVFAAPNIYRVTLTVTDSAGLTGTTAQDVNVGGGAGARAQITANTTLGTTATVFNFDASGSAPSPGATITEYRFNFGDNTPEVVNPAGQPTRTHQFAAPGTYIVSVTILDSTGRRATASIQVTVTN